jgi:outer membrane protein assembly factor BamB
MTRFRFPLFLQIATLVIFWPVLTAMECVRGDDWPQWRGVQRDGVWREAGIREELPDGQLALTWSVDIGPGYSGPTVAKGRVYVMDRKADDRRQTERVLCFDSTDGKLVWSKEYEALYKVGYPAGPRASVTVDGGMAYAVGSMGHFHCLNADTGEVVWKRDLQTEYDIQMPIWGIAASPLIYNDLVVQQVGGANNACVVAFNKKDGKEIWRALPDRAGYSSPIVIQQADRDVLVCWTGDSLSGLNPKSGEVVWSHSFRPSRMPIGISTPVLDGEMLFVSSFYDGSMMVRVPKATLTSELVWQIRGPDEKNTKSIHSMIGTNILESGYVYGADSYGEFRCLDATTGERIWEDLTAVPKARWAAIHMVRNGENIWMFNERGELLISKLSPKGLQILDRCQLIEPTTDQLPSRGGVCWSHPAFAEKSVFARNDKSLVKASLAR